MVVVVVALDLHHRVLTSESFLKASQTSNTHWQQPASAEEAYLRVWVGQQVA